MSTFDSTKRLLPEILAEIVKAKIQLPDFQRGWVWDDQHIRSLLVSIARSFPVGAVMLLETGGEAKGLFHQPTVLSGVKPGMRAFDEETFGPVANIIRFANDAEAVELANRHEGALAAAVISRDVGRAMRISEGLASAIDASMEGRTEDDDRTFDDKGNIP